MSDTAFKGVNGCSVVSWVVGIAASVNLGLAPAALALYVVLLPWFITHNEQGMPVEPEYLAPIVLMSGSSLCACVNEHLPRFPRGGADVCSLQPDFARTKIPGASTGVRL